MKHFLVPTLFPSTLLPNLLSPKQLPKLLSVLSFATSLEGLFKRKHIDQTSSCVNTRKRCHYNTSQRHRTNGVKLVKLNASNVLNSTNLYCFVNF